MSIYKIHVISLGLLLQAALPLVSCLGVDPETPTPVYPNKGTPIADPVPKGIVALTFDDGPSDYLADILDILKKHQAPATFFFLGTNIPGRRDLIARARDEGHQVGNHTFNHYAAPSLSFEEFKYQITTTKMNIGQTDNGRLFFRFPYGQASDENLAWLKKISFDGNTYRAVGWNASTEDAYAPEDFSQRVANQVGSCGGQENPFPEDLLGWTQFIVRMRTGGVILFHETKSTRDSLEAILTGLKNADSYWKSLPAEQSALYKTFYQCWQVDPNQSFTFSLLNTGHWPSFADPKLPLR